MTLLTRWPATQPDSISRRTADPSEIADELTTLGIAFAQWPVQELPHGASSEEILSAYAAEIERLTSEHGFTVVDVAQLHPSDDPAWAETAAGARTKFLAEHTHGEDEVRFFVQGAGIFYLHVEHPTDGDSVVAVLCEAGDLLSVPALTRHWFDMGTRPDFTAVRLFVNPDGWVGSFTGDEIASGFADFDTLVAGR